MKTDKEKYLSKCPICLKEHSEQIFKDGLWHCKLCGILCYSPEYRNEIDNLLSKPGSREILIAFVREQKKINSFVNINPKVIKKVLKEKGIVI